LPSRQPCDLQFEHGSLDGSNTISHCKSAANDAPGATEINGNAIVITSPYTNTFSTPLTIYEWNSTTSTLSTFPNVSNASKDDSYVTHLLVLPNGQIMFTDFSTNGVEILTSAGTYQSAWQPTITTAPDKLDDRADLLNLRNAVQRAIDGSFLRRRFPGQYELSPGANR
jgi:hypothetical protein